jgi:hypothetical protein
MTERAAKMVTAESRRSRQDYRPSHMRRDGDCVVLNIPMAFRRRSGRREIILPQSPDGTAAAQPEPNRALVLAIARAWRWQEMLDRGEVGSVDELARQLRRGPTYVARILCLTCLAPDIVEAILVGEEPDGMSLRSLSGNLPLDWDEQRRNSYY